jgi:hypothetical protein
MRSEQCGRGGTNEAMERGIDGMVSVNEGYK